MKAKLIKREDGLYFLNDENGKLIYEKLSIKNCQAIELGYDLDDKVSKHLEKNHIEASAKRVQVIRELILEILGDKKFSEEDVRRAIEIARMGSMQEQHNGYGRPTELRFVLDNISSDEIIQSLQQTEWDVEIEMEETNDLTLSSFKSKPKLDKEGCLILKRSKSE